jgi:uncharacterized protein YcgI (DUF1989 family)
VVRRDQRIRIIDVTGGAIGDFVIFNASDTRERFSQARTKADEGRYMVTTGNHLYSRDNNVMLTILEDTYGVHDLQYGMCSAWVYQNFSQKDYHGFSANGFQVGGPLGVPSFGCYEVLQKALRPFSIAPEDIPDPLNLFQTIVYDHEGKTIRTVDGGSKPGDYVDFVARMDTVCALSACPGAGRPLRVQIYDP